MPNIKSQVKRSLTNIKRNAAVKSQKSAIKTGIKKVLTAVEAKDKEAATQAYNDASKLLDASITNHVHNKNYVARQKSRLAKAVNSINA